MEMQDNETEETVDDYVVEELKAFNDAYNDMHNCVWFVIVLSFLTAMVLGAYVIMFLFTPEGAEMNFMPPIFMSIMYVISMAITINKYNKLSDITRMRLSFILIENNLLLEELNSVVERLNQSKKDD